MKNKFFYDTKETNDNIGYSVEGAKDSGFLQYPSATCPEKQLEIEILPEDITIKNPSYQNSYSFASMAFKEYEFIRKVNIGDFAVYSATGICEGMIKAITMRGVNVSTPYGDRFIKWKNVKEIMKRSEE